MNVFAGFWVDGAARKPEKRHADKEGFFVAKWKSSQKEDFDLLLSRFDKWDSVYWLDTTPRESLTPEELFCTLKLLFPSITHVKNEQDVLWSTSQVGEGIACDFGGLEEWPPRQWVRVTRENLSKYILQPCRMRKGDLTYSGTVAGWHLEDDQCLVSSTYDEDDSVLEWDCVEVCIDPAA